jgi:hypothetical protein
MEWMYIFSIKIYNMMNFYIKNNNVFKNASKVPNHL